MPKLVRDFIPTIIQKAGQQRNTYQASHEEYRVLLHEKLLEEVHEYLAAESPEELADILEVLDAIMQMKGLDKKTVEGIQLVKRNSRGGFFQRIVLE